jgi:hypothetical protein
MSLGRADTEGGIVGRLDGTSGLAVGLPLGIVEMVGDDVLVSGPSGISEGISEGISVRTSPGEGAIEGDEDIEGAVVMLMANCWIAMRFNSSSIV